MKLLIKQLLRENLSYGYFKDKTSIPDFDALKNGLYSELPPVYKKQEAHVVFMSKNEYLYECANLQGGSVEQQEAYIDNDKVKLYMEDMQAGSKFNMGYLNYVTKQQEGRHRILAAAALGQTNIPVLIIEKKDTSNGSLELKIGEWKDLQKDSDGDFIVKYNLKDGDDDTKLLRVFANDYDYYLLDDILSDKIYHHENNYNKLHRQIIGNKVKLNDYNIEALFPNEFLDKLNFEIDPETGDKEFNLTPEQIAYIKFIIYVSSEDETKRVNSQIFDYIHFEDRFNAFVVIPNSQKFSDLDNFNNAKDLLTATKPFDVNLKDPSDVEPTQKDIINNLRRYPI